MRIHHRTPTIFNLSMVDVLCCALGSVILLWLLNLQEAKVKSVAAGQASELLSKTRQELESTSARLTAAQAEHDRQRAELDAADRRLTAAEQTLTQRNAEKRQAEKRLALLTQDRHALTIENEAVRKETVTLQARLHEQEVTAQTVQRRRADLAELLRKAESRIKRLQELADQVAGLRTELDAAHASVSESEAKLRTLGADAAHRQSDLAQASRTSAALERDKKALIEQLVRVKSAAENRFEGITLTGKRVIFLVDMSGSMELVDERTPDDHKWAGVRETLAKVMRSLPDLSKFQVIIFSDRISYLLGGDNRWLDFDPSKSATQAYAALAQIKPKGATNMYDAFEAAFRYRAAGLDTIYVLSDGLPNIGPGLTPEQANLPNENERSDILARHIRGLLRRDWNRAQELRPRVKINTIGFFFESPDVGAFLWALARENDGSFVGMSKP
jgi:hypothetical protein